LLSKEYSFGKRSCSHRWVFGESQTSLTRATSLTKASRDIFRSPKPSLVFAIRDIPSMAKDNLSVAVSSRKAGFGLADGSSNLSHAISL
jgi:hypothetical protein